MKAIMLISLGAILGAVFRWKIGMWINGWFQSFFLGTLAINIIGCFLIGLLLGLNLQDSTRLIAITGFLGSFTTFSAFSMEVSQSLLAEKWLNAFIIFSCNSIGGIFATVCGTYFVKISTH
ncbi:fluoride efflux transporter FluC [Ursidibacter arcticus]